MKEIDNKKLCKFCLGCNKLENDNFDGIMRCSNFMTGIENWQEKWKEQMKNGNKDTFNV